MTMKVKINIKELKFKVPIVVEPDGNGFYAHSPALPGLMMDGETEKEALDNARLTAKDMLVIMIEEGIPIPISTLIWDKNNKSDFVNDKGYYEEEIILNLQ